MGKFSYKPRSFESSRKRAEQASGSKDSYIKDTVRFWKPAEGDNLIRILPPSWENAEHYGLDIYVHWGIGADKSAYLCPKMKGQDKYCPICEEREKALKDGDEDYAAKLKSKKRVMVYLIDRDKENDGPMVWAMPWTVDRDIMVLAVDSRTKEVLPIDHPDRGFDVEIKRTGTNERTEYNPKIARKESMINLSDDTIDLLENDPLPSLLVYYDGDYIKKVFSGVAATTSTSNDEKVEKPTKPSKTEEPSRRSKQEEKSDRKIPTYEQLMGMSIRDLEDLCSDFKLNISPDEYDDSDFLAQAIASELGIEAPKIKEVEKEPDRQSTVKQGLAALRNRRQATTD